MKNKEIQKIQAVLCDMLKTVIMGRKAPVFIDGEQWDLLGIITPSNQIRVQSGDTVKFAQIGDIDKDKLPYGIGDPIQVYREEDDKHDPMEWRVNDLRWINDKWEYHIYRAGYFEDESNLEEWAGIQHHNIRPFDDDEVIKYLTGTLKIFGTRSSRAHHTAEYKDEDGQWHDFTEYGSDQHLWDRLSDLIY